VSQTLGAALEHFATAQDQALRVVVGSDPIHDLVFDPPSSVKKLMHFVGIPVPDVRLVGDPSGPALFRNGYPLRITATAGSVTISAIRCEVKEWARDIHLAQLYGNNTVEFWSEANAIRRAHEEVFEALTDLRHAEVREIPLTEFLETQKQKKVLLLGDYSGDGRSNLEAIKEALFSLGYEPVLVDEIDDHPFQNLRQKSLWLASLARFVVVEDSVESGHLVELTDLLNNSFITVVLRREGRQSTFMIIGASHFYKGVQEFEYLTENMTAVLRAAVEWAEYEVERYRRIERELYPWRRDVTGRA
jgi:hypothetical protein